VLCVILELTGAAGRVVQSSGKSMQLDNGTLTDRIGNDALF
jgi:hypothetical protein